MRIAFRADASAVIGVGHVMRCATLADFFRAQGHECVFYAGRGGVDLSWLRARGHGLVEADFGPLPMAGAFESHGFHLQHDQARDLEVFLKTVEAPELVVVDHYGLGRDWHLGVRDRFPEAKILAIDDLGNRRLGADVVLDPNQSPEVHRRYPSLVDEGTRLLLGLPYCFFLLRDDFRAWRADARARAGFDGRLLIFFGGTDSLGFCTKAVQAAASELAHWRRVDVVLGRSQGQDEPLARLAAAIPALKIHHHVPDLGRLMAAADLAIGAGGVSAWERAYLGAPSIVYAMSDNQEPAGEAIRLRDAGIYGGRAEAFDAKVLASWLTKLRLSSERRARMKNNALSLWSSEDEDRLAREMRRLLAQADLTFRPATDADARFLFDLRNDPVTRAMSKRTDQVPWENHLRWLSGRLASPKGRLWIATVGGRPAGQFRYDEDDLVSLAVAPEFRGFGLASEIVRRGSRLAAREFGRPRLRAHVREDNRASQQAFLSAGYRRLGGFQEDGVPFVDFEWNNAIGQNS